LFTADAPLGALTSVTLAVQSITLTDSCGASTTVYSGTPQNTVDRYQDVEFVHVNAASEPLTIATVPQATYVAAAVTTTANTLGFVYPNSSQFNGSTFTTNPTVAKTELDAPFSIAATGNALEFSLVIPAPIDITTLGTLGDYVPVFTPSFLARHFTPATTPANDREGLSSVRGLTVSSTATQLTMNNSLGIPLGLTTDSKTVLQGVGSVSAIPASVPASVDVMIRQDGSLYASRIQIEDANTKGSWVGPLVITYAQGIYEWVAPQWWMQPSDPGHTTNTFPFAFQFTANTNYQLQGSAVDLTDLPFTPHFASFSDVMLGQGIAVDWIEQQLYGNQPLTEADSAVLIPSTFSGTITTMQQQANYVSYTLALDAHDTLTTVANETSIMAYSNAGTRMEDGSLAAGDKVNLHGFLFSDAGTPRLVCDQTRLQRKP